MGMKLNFKFENWEKIYKGFPRKEIFLWKLLVKLTGEKFIRDFLIKNIIHRNYLSNEVGKIYN